MPATIPVIIEKINAGTKGSLIERIKIESTKPNNVAISVEKAIIPR